MEKSFLLKWIFYLSMVFFFFFPFVHLLFYIPLEWIFWDPGFFKTFMGAFVQASLSGFITVFLGFVGALGYLAHVSRSPFSRSLLHFFIMAPSFIPPLICVLWVSPLWGSFPRGLGAIVFFHSLTNVGLIGLILAGRIREKARGWAALCQVEGVSFSRFVFRGLWPGVMPDLKVLFIFLFILYFLSFSFPLLLGGGAFAGVEVFIFEKIFLFGDWNEALQYSLFLMFALFFLSLFVGSKEYWKAVSFSDSPLAHYSSSWFLLLLLGPAFFLSVGFLLSTSFHPWNFWDHTAEMGMTLLTGLLTGCGLFILFSVLGYCYASDRGLRWMFSIVAPSWVVVGFSFFLWGRYHMGTALLKTVWALTLLYAPYLYRLAYFSKLSELRPQVEIAQVSGACWNKIFFTILWPQLLPRIGFLSGLGALWACGDFALSSMIFEGDLSLALKIQSFLQNYRLDRALDLLGPLSFSCFMVYLVFQGLAYVCRRSFSSGI